jgi:hypothetical protein
MPLWRDRSLLKRWRYAGIYGPELMICVGAVRIGPFPQSFWAVWDRERGALHEHTLLRGGPAEVSDELARVSDGDVRIDLRLVPGGDPVEVVSPHGGSYIWTRKQGFEASGTVTINGETRELRGAAGLADHSAGYFARRTAWEWCAGAGRDSRGRALLWNLVAGVHDAPVNSERTVWVDGAAREVGPVSFSSELDAVDFREGGRLSFREESVRRRRERMLLIASDYVQPFGSFSGTLPDGAELAEGYGVMERHSARW